MVPNWTSVIQNLAVGRRQYEGERLLYEWDVRRWNEAWTTRSTKWSVCSIERNVRNTESGEGRRWYEVERSNTEWDVFSTEAGVGSRRYEVERL